MKYIKKISYVLLIIILLGVQVVIPDFIPEAEAKSLKNLKDELATLKKEYQENQGKQQATEAEIQAANNQITKLSEEKFALEEEIENLNAQIEQLNQDIENKNEDIKEIIQYYQLTATGQNAYLEYVFASTDFTDFIYRMAIAEQLSDYNEELIREYEDLIIESERKKQEVSNKIVELNKKSKELERNIVELQNVLSETMDGAISIEEEIASVEKIIKSYEKYYIEYKCDETEEYSACMAKAPSNQLPPGTAFYRPVVSGTVSSNFGPRSFMLNGKPYSDFHYGLDFATSHGSKIYSVANGKVVYIQNAKASYDKNKEKVCGGNKIYITHTVNGKNYTSAYFHVASINVKVGDIVTYDTVVATVGGVPSIEYWESPRCSTGAHVHLQLATGHYLSDYMFYSNFTAKSFNPRNVLNAPAEGKRFTDRKTKY